MYPDASDFSIACGTKVENPEEPKTCFRTLKVRMLTPRTETTWVDGSFKGFGMTFSRSLRMSGKITRKGVFLMCVFLMWKMNFVAPTVQIRMEAFFGEGESGKMGFQAVVAPLKSSQRVSIGLHITLSHIGRCTRYVGKCEWSPRTLNVCCIY